MILLGISYFGDSTSFLPEPVYIDKCEKIEVKECKIDDLFVTKKTNVTSATVLKWDSSTLLYATFNNNLEGGNASYLLSTIDEMRILKRKVGTFDWVTIYTKPISSINDIKIVYQDIMNANDTEYEYDVVSVKNGIIQEHSKAIGKSEFEGLYLIGMNKTYHSIFNINDGNNYNYNRNFSGNIIKPVDSEFPYYIKNSTNDYDSGNYSATFVEVQNDGNHNWSDGYNYRDELLNFLSDGKPKIMKEDFGLTRLISILGDSISNTSSGHRENVRTSFQWAETGKMTSSTDLYNAGFIKINIEGS